MDYDVIKRLCEKKKVDIKLLAAKSNLTEAGLHKMIRNKSMKVENLEKVAEVLNVSMSVFFEDGEEKSITDWEKKYYELLEKYAQCLESKTQLK